MSLGVLNNLNAIYAENNLNNSNTSLSKVLNQLSSGSKINSGADDAAGLSLVDGLQANQSALTQSVTNATEGVGLLQVADGALSQVTSLLNRAVTLATEASNGTLNSSQDTAANQEYQSILSEISNIGSTTTYNDAAVFGKNTNIYTGDSSTTGSSINELNIRSLSSSNIGDSGGVMSYSNGQNNVFLNLSSSTANAAATDYLTGGVTGTTNLAVNYLVKGSDGSVTTSQTTITVGGSTGIENTANGLISAINSSGLGLTASFATQAQSGVQGGGTQTGIEITGGLVSAGVDPGTTTTSGILNPTGITANEILTQGQGVTIAVAGDSNPVATIRISSSTSTLTLLASAINNASGNLGIADAPSKYVTATVVTNSNGTQSLSLADSASGGGALTVTTSAGGAIVPAFNLGGVAGTAGTVGSLTSNIQTVGTANATGTAAQSAVDGAATVGTGEINASDSTVAGTFVISNTPAVGSAVTETFVMGGTSGGAYANGTYTVQGNTLAALTTAITNQNASGGDIGVTVGNGAATNTTAFTLTGAAGHTVTINATGGTFTNSLTGATQSMTTAAGASANIAVLNVTQNNAGTDSETGSIVVTNGTGTATTFVMGTGTNNATSGVVGGVAAYTYYTANQTLTAGEIANGDGKNTLAGLKDLVNNKMSASVTATVNNQGLTVTSNTALTGDNVTITNNTLANTNQTLGLYTPTLATVGDYDTAQLAVTNSAGTQVIGSIGSNDNLAGSIVITNGGVSDTFVMGTNSHGTNATGIDSTVNGGDASATGSNEYWVGNGGSAALATAINTLAAAEIAAGSASSGIQLNAEAAPSGGVYLQSTTVDDGSTYDGITMSASTLAVAQAATATNSVNGVTVAAGTASTVTVAPASGTINTSDTLTGSVTLTNTPAVGTALTEKFVLGGSGGMDGGGTGTLSGTPTNGTFTVNGSTLADLQAAINSQTTAGAGSLGLGLTSLASTNGLSVSTSTNNGNTVGATSALVDTTVGTASSISMGSFATENDTVAGNLSFKVGTTASGTINLTAGETVSQMIHQISTGGYGVTAQWVAPTGSNNFGSVELTSNNANTPTTSYNITAATEDITDTPTSANLSYTATDAYNTGLSGSITDSTNSASATFVANSKAGSVVATLSYSDGAGQSLSATDLSNQTDAQSALTNLNTAITAVAAQDGYIGAQINTLNAVSQVISTQQENVQSAQNAVQATDYASATSNMSKYEILSQTGIAALAQANSVQQEVTKLLQ